MRNVLLGLMFVLAVGALGYGIGQWRSQDVVMAPPANASAQTAYVCPMHSHIVQDHPGTCPICGMDLVASGESTNAASQIHVDTATQQKLGVRLAVAAVTDLSHEIHTYGTVVVGEAGAQRITAAIDGVIEKMHVYPGQKVARGQLLYEVSSQDALAIQNEYIDLMRRNAPILKIVEERREQNRKMLADTHTQDAAAREYAERQVRQAEEQLQGMLQPVQRDRERVLLRLRQIGFADELAAKVVASGQALRSIPVRAREACVVKEVMARPGMSVSAMSEILSCSNLQRGGLDVVLYPDQLEWVNEGDAVTVDTTTGEALETELTGLSGQLDSVSRTLRVRLPITTTRLGRVGDYVDVTIRTAPRHVLSIPKSALMRSGHGNFVMRAMGHGHFMPVKVAAGIETAERVAIIQGLEAGQEVAVNGQFLIDAAASIADSVQRMKVGAGDTPKKQ